MRRERILKGKIYSLVREGERFAAIRVGADGLILEAYPEGAPLPPDVPSEDLPGAAAVPAFTDSHVHLMPKAGLGALALRLSRLEGGTITPDCLDGVHALLSAEAERKPRGPLVGYGLFPGALAERRLPLASELDAWFPGRSVLVFSLDGHASAYSTAALNRLSLESSAVDGLLTGEAHEYNMGRVTAFMMGNLSPAAIARGLSDCMEEAASSGIVALHCLEGFDDERRDRATDILAIVAGRLPVDLRLYLQYLSLDKVRRIARRFGRRDEKAPGHKRAGGCMSWEMDGSVSSRSAAFDRPFLDRDHAGRLYKSPDEALAMVGPFYREGWQTAAHAIGPRGIESILSAYETLMDGAGDRDNRLRLRIEHFEFPRPDQIERAGRRRLALSVQPGFSWFDDRYLRSYAEALGADAVSGMLPLRSLMQAGAVLSLSTDAPVQPFDPFIQIAGAVEHPVASERLTVFEALRAYSLGGAWAAFDEGKRGTVEPGKLADLAALDRDPFLTPSAELYSIKAVATYKSGRPMRAPPHGLAGFLASCAAAKRKPV